MRGNLSNRKVFTILTWLPSPDDMASHSETASVTSATRYGKNDVRR